MHFLFASTHSRAKWRCAADDEEEEEEDWSTGAMEMYCINVLMPEFPQKCWNIKHGNDHASLGNPHTLYVAVSDECEDRTNKRPRKTRL
jgi:hypothetical protein